MKIVGMDIGAINSIDSYKPPTAKELQQDETKSVVSMQSGRNEQNVKQCSQGELEEAVGQLNDTMEAYSTELRFKLHEKSGEIMVTVINQSDDTVIREIPPERVLDMVAHFKKVLGIIVDKLI